MKIKTITVFGSEDLNAVVRAFDREVNEFESKNNVQFTQTHVLKNEKDMIYTAVLFFKEKQ